MSTAVIAANGTLQADPRLCALWEMADLRIAADGGARNAREQLGARPHVLIGDLDSLDPETAEWIRGADVEVQRYPPAKDQTDLELALDLAEARGAGEITILGALGGRPDQMLGNVLLLTREPNVVLADATAELWVVRGETEIHGRADETVSLLPLNAQVQGIETENLEYPLRHETLALGTTRGISNRMLGSTARVRISSGLLLVVHLFQTQ